MNKKFSTLMAGLVLASGVATAQHGPSVDGFPYRTQNTLSAAVGAGINQIESMNKWYQLTDGSGNVLVQVRNQQTGAVTLKMVSAATAPMNTSLWKIKVTTHPTTASKTFAYVNKETNLELVLDHTKAVAKSADGTVTNDATILDGCTKDWGWYTTDVQTSNFAAAPIYSYFNAASDSVMVMQLNGASEVVAVKYSKAVAGTGLTSLSNTLKLQPVMAGAKQLTAQDINQMIDAQRASVLDINGNETMFAGFKFNKPNGQLNGTLQDVFQNTLTSSDYRAEDAVAFQQFGIIGLTAVKNDVLAAQAALSAAAAALNGVLPKNSAVLTDVNTAKAAGLIAKTAADGITTTALDAAITAVSKDLSDPLNVPATMATAAGTAFTAGATQLGTAAVVTPPAAATGIVLNFDNAIAALETAKTSTEIQNAAALQSVIDVAKAAREAILAAATKATKGAADVVAIQAATYDLYNIRLLAQLAPVATKNYFMVDTARYEEAQTPLLSPAYKLSNKEIKNISADGAYLLARYFFKVTYYPSNDSLFIEPLNAASKTDAEKLANTTWLNTLAGTKWVKDADMTAANRGIAISNSDCATSPATDHVSLTTTILASGNTVATVGRQDFGTRISFDHEYTYFTRTSLPNGAYYAQLVTKMHPVSQTNRAGGQYVVANMAGSIVYEEWASTQDFEHMPATQWVIEQLGCVDAINPRVRITNREYDDLIAFEGQLYKDGDAVYIINHDWNERDINYNAPGWRFNCMDTIKLTAVTDVKVAQAGFLNLAPNEVIDNSFKLKHFSDYGDVYLKALVGTKDTLLNVAADGSNFELVPYSGVWYNNQKYGKVGLARNGVDTVVPQLFRSTYLLKVKDFDKINNDQRFVGITKEGNYAIIDTINAKSNLAYPAYFYLKENDHKGDHAYALVNKNGGFNASGNPVGSYYDGADKLFVENKTSMAKKGALGERQTDDFFMVKDTMPYYKRIAVQDTVAFYDAINARRVMIEDFNSPYSKDKGVGFLGFRSLDEAPALAAAPSMYVDTAYVRNETRMPLYLLAVGAEHKATKACDHAFDIANPGHTVHFEARPYIQGRYLIDLSKYVPTNSTVAPFEKSLADTIPYIDAKNAIHEGIYTRLAFVNAIHMGDSLYILNDAEATYEYEDSIIAKATVILPIEAEKHNGATVAFRLKDQDNDENFYIETAGQFAGFAAQGGAWVKNQNNVAVLATNDSKFYTDHNGNMRDYAKEDIYQGTVFTLKHSSENPTDNEEIGTSEITVIAGAGSVEIVGAAGKKVVISNILGQAIANTVLTSDNAKVSVPAGIVVVAVEGEEAVKAIVK